MSSQICSKSEILTYLLFLEIALKGNGIDKTAYYSVKPQPGFDNCWSIGCRSGPLSSEKLKYQTMLLCPLPSIPVPVTELLYPHLPGSALIVAP